MRRDPQEGGVIEEEPGREWQQPETFEAAGDAPAPSWETRYATVEDLQALDLMLPLPRPMSCLG
jgi:hypothetical protein